MLGGNLIGIPCCINRDTKWPGDCFPPGFLFKVQNSLSVLCIVLNHEEDTRRNERTRDGDCVFFVTSDEWFSVLASNPLTKKFAGSRTYLYFGNFLPVSWETTWKGEEILRDKVRGFISGPVIIRCIITWKSYGIWCLIRKVAFANINPEDWWKDQRFL